MVVITKFTAADVAVAYCIFKTDRISPWAYTTFEKSALNNLSLVAKENSSIVGYVLLSSVLDEFTFEDITVDKAHRGKGIGRKLVQASFTMATKMQQKCIYLEVRFSNKPAIELYRSMGFVLVGERKNYYDTARDVDRGTHTDRKITPAAPRENAYIMKKIL